MILSFRQDLSLSVLSFATTFQALFPVDTYNFSLTCECAEQLSINITDRQEMRRMLAQLHMTAWNDTRSIKVILGANVSITIFKLYKPCFWSQVSKFNFTFLLVDGFFAYFPQARPTNLLYQAFAEAYLEECIKIGDAAEQLSQVFIATSEIDQVHRVACFHLHWSLLSSRQ
jgi:hypothetical protein